MRSRRPIAQRPWRSSGSPSARSASCLASAASVSASPHGGAPPPRTRPPPAAPAPRCATRCSRSRPMTAASALGRPARIAARRPALPALFAVLGLAAVLLRAVPAVAHANLVRSDPAAGAVLAMAPAQVQLWFSEEPDPHFSDVQVTDANGRRVDRSDMHVAPGDRLSLIAGVNSSLPDGLYTIVWKTVSAVDGHVVNGGVPFYVGQPPAGVNVPAAAQSGPAG